MPSENSTDITGIIHTNKAEANAIVRKYISHIDELKDSLKKNYDEMEMENTDMKIEIADIVADITTRLEQLVDSIEDVRF